MPNREIVEMKKNDETYHEIVIIFSLISNILFVHEMIAFFDPNAII